jgi:hypothetical protein
MPQSLSSRRTLISQSVIPPRLIFGEPFTSCVFGGQLGEDDRPGAPGRASRVIKVKSDLPIQLPTKFELRLCAILHLMRERQHN